MIAIDLSKQKKLDDDSKAIQQFNFTGNIDQPKNTTMFLQENFRLFTRFYESTIYLFWFRKISI